MLRSRQFRSSLPVTLLPALCLPWFVACAESKSSDSTASEAEVTAASGDASALDAAAAHLTNSDAAQTVEAVNDAGAGEGSRLFDTTRVGTLDIEVSDADLQQLRTDADQPMGYEDFMYVPAQITYDGHVLGRVGIRVKGNSSRTSAMGDAVPFKIDTNRYVDGQKLDGQTKINLHNNVGQPALMNEYLSYAALRNQGIAASRTGWADVTLNGTALGTYTVVEQVGDKLLSRYYADGEANLYKPEPPSGYLTYNGDDFSSYPTADYEGNAETDHATFLKLVKTINEASAEAWDAVIDVGSVLDYFAANVALGNWDTYVAMGHNYYLFEATPGRLVMLPWDMNLSQSGASSVCPGNLQMGGFQGMAPPGGEMGLPPTGAGGFPGGSGLLTEPPPGALDGGLIPPPDGVGFAFADAGTAGAWGAGGAPLHDNLLSDPVYLNRYLGHLRAFLEGAGSVAATEALIAVGEQTLGSRVTATAVQDMRDAVRQRVANLTSELQSTKSCVPRGAADAGSL